jgi:cell division protein FtsW
MFQGTRENVLALALSVLVLTVLGVVMLFSTGTFTAGADPGDLYFDVKRQIVWLMVGIPLAIYAALVNLEWPRRLCWVFWGCCVIFLLLCFVPGVGREINGERRWIHLGMRFQPSEIAKPTLVLALANWYGRDRGQGLWAQLLAPVLLASAVVVPVALEVDIGTAGVLAAMVFAVFHAAGVDRRWLVGGAVSAVVAFALLVMCVPGRMERVWAVWQPGAHAQGVGLQQRIAEVALGSGGINGMGLGAGRMKMLYMPFAHTDFVFPMIGEELGLSGTLLVVAGFTVFALSGLAIAQRAADRFSQVLAVGVTWLVAGQAFLNIAVTTGTFPNTGLPLPFVSYGG